jgi:hypothetical protein
VPTRFYLPSTTGAPGVSPTISAEWEHQNTARRQTSTAKAGSAFASTAYSPDGADHLANADAHIVQFISAPLAAQSIAAQTLQITLLCSEAHASNNLFLTWKVYLCDSAGTPGVTLLAIRRDATETSTSLTNRTDSAVSTDVTANDGDRVVIELGLGGTPTASGGVQGHNGTLRFGDPVGGADLVANDSATADAAPWLEFATSTLSFGNAVTAA